MATILAVDDSASMRQMVVFTLKGAGYDVTEASDGAEALKIAKTKAFNLVLTDVNMPIWTVFRSPANYANCLIINLRPF